MPIPLLTATLLAIPPLDAPGLHFIDVGQGSALLIRGESGEVVLVDSGPSSGAEAILAALLAHDVESVGLWIHTHYDADHIGGFARVAAGLDGVWPSEDDLQIDRLWDRGVASPIPDTDATSLYFGLVGDRRERPEPGLIHAGEGLRIEVLELDPQALASVDEARLGSLPAIADESEVERGRVGVGDRSCEAAVPQAVDLQIVFGRPHAVEPRGDASEAADVIGVVVGVNPEADRVDLVREQGREDRLGPGGWAGVDQHDLAGLAADQ
ncbi:MAG TPA: MBL fold metallo-hydrolase, partial [Enhygromyxa sp.]|nr:MBL fold metallo-hydrolase [Enhygromyxa sp.]